MSKRETYEARTEELITPILERSILNSWMWSM